MVSGKSQYVDRIRSLKDFHNAPIICHDSITWLHEFLSYWRGTDVAFLTHYATSGTKKQDWHAENKWYLCHRPFFVVSHLLGF